MTQPKCSRCNRHVDVRICEYLIDGVRRTLLCDPCVELTSTYHDIDQVGAPDPIPVMAPPPEPPAPTPKRSRSRRRTPKAKA